SSSNGRTKDALEVKGRSRLSQWQPARAGVPESVAKAVWCRPFRAVRGEFNLAAGGLIYVGESVTTRRVATLLEELGGEPALRLLINHFIDRVFEDPMIGCLFRSATRERIKEMEYQFAA